MSQQDMRPDSPVELIGTRSMSALERALRFQPKLQMRTSALALNGQEAKKAPGNLHGDLTFMKL